VNVTAIRRRVPILVLATAIQAAALHAEPANASSSSGPGTHIIGSGDAFARVAPVGIALVAGVRYKHVSSFDEEEHYDVSSVEFGGTVLACPAYVEPGVHIEYLPFPFLVLRAEGDIFKFTGAYAGLLRFPSAGSAFGDTQLNAMRGQEQGAWAERGAATATLRAKVGPMIARSETTVGVYHFEDKGPYLYESEYDTLLARSDALVDNRSQLFVQAYRGSGDVILLVGPAYEVTRSIATGLNRERVGGALVLVPADAWGDFRRPRLVIYAGVNVTDPNRTGTPFGLLGLGFDIE
jgi:hypothetical protein